VCIAWHDKCIMSPACIPPEGKWVRRLKQGLGCAFPSSFLANSLSIAATAFPPLEQASLPHDLSLGGDDENPIALSFKSISGARIFNEHTKENRGSDWHPGSLRPRTVGGHSDGPASDSRPLLRQWPGGDVDRFCEPRGSRPAHSMVVLGLSHRCWRGGQETSALV
jgi:hypothetical protein